MFVYGYAYTTIPKHSEILSIVMLAANSLCSHCISLCLHHVSASLGIALYFPPIIFYIYIFIPSNLYYLLYQY